LTGDHTDEVVVPRGLGWAMFPSPPRPGRSRSRSHPCAGVHGWHVADAVLVSVRLGWMACVVPCTPCMFSAWNGHTLRLVVGIVRGPLGSPRIPSFVPDVGHWAGFGIDMARWVWDVVVGSRLRC
jgi:hypothetical protein